MKLIIDIPDNIYDAIKSAQTIVSGQRSGKTFLQILVSSVENGTPLPKGHGRLIDAEKIESRIDALKSNWNRCKNEYESGRYESYDYAVDEIDDAPTIIEADKAESEDKE